jgi:hypothetical protein
MNRFMTFERKTISGQPNPKYIDLLDEDKPIAQQKFVCVSFVSPEKIIKSKECYFFEQYLKGWELTKSMEKYAQFTSFLSFKYGLNVEQVTEDLTEFCKEERASLVQESIWDDYKSFLDKNEDKLEQEYTEAHSFQTNTRGIKVRGIFPSQKEAELRAKLLREMDPNFDVYVGPVGIWMPWEPDAYKTGRVEYLEEELNQLMNQKKMNEDSAKEYFNKRVVDSKQKAIEENKRKAQETGNKLTQCIDKEGNLKGVGYMSQMAELNENSTSADVKKVLFEQEISK